MSDYSKWCKCGRRVCDRKGRNHSNGPVKRRKVKRARKH